jgi:malonate-semialdehyde dehydrogenase (acetylating) / methylmalonate-semialdehyde dehydrogenase
MTTIPATEPATVGHWIDGRVSAIGERTGEICDPVLGQVAKTVTYADQEVVNRAVAAARTALPAWSSLSLSRRAAVMRRLHGLVERRADDLAAIVTREHGKTVEDARAEVARGLEVLETAAVAHLLLKGEFSDEYATAIDVYSLRQPLGVCVGITPFNFPVMLPLWMYPLALVAGNTFVLKPSERDPSASLLLAELTADAGVPAGVLNVVQGDAEAVGALIDHPDTAAVSFVGSSAIAGQVYARAAAAGKRVQALGGAKNHMVVLPDADLDAAADALASACFGSSGQRCMAISTAVAVGECADPLVERVAARAAALRVGPASEPDTDLGPLITGTARDRVVAYIDRAEEVGASIVVDGRSAREDLGGFFIGPTVVDEVAPSSDLYRDEVFGPVLGVVRVDSFDEALALVNSHAYGNGAAIFTRDGALARRFQREASAGMIGVNVPVPVPVAAYSFGGWKQSLFGDAHIYGAEGLRFYTRAKVVTSRWVNPTEGVSLAFPRIVAADGDTGS